MLIELDSRHPVPVPTLGGTTTVSVASGDTVYYADSYPVSASANQGSLTAGGGSVTFSQQMFAVSASQSVLDLTYAPAPIPQVELPASVGNASSQNVDVRTYGADPTGATSSTTAIASAIIAAGAGGALYFPSGTFTADNLSPLSGQRWYGPGTLKRPVASATDLIKCNAITDVTIEVSLDGGYTGSFAAGNSGALAATGNLVNITGASSNVHIKSKLLANNQGTAVRIYDSSNCSWVGDRIFNCIYGVTIGSGGTISDPGAVCNNNTVAGRTISTTGKNGVYLSGRTDSGISPNLIYGHVVRGVTIFQPGDTGIEIGQGCQDCVVTNFVIDGNNIGYNGILVRDGDGHSITNGIIKNFPMFANGSSTDLTLGNGIYFWPQYTGSITACTVGSVKIKNCSRGVFAAGNNFAAVTTTVSGTQSITPATTTVTVVSTTGMSSSGVVNIDGNVIAYTGITSTTLTGCSTGATFTATNGDTVTGYATSVTNVAGGPGGAGTVYAGNTLTGVIVDGTQLGTVAGAVQTTLQCHGFYIQSVSHYTLTGCVAKNCQNDGFRIGDNAQAGTYATDILIKACRAFNNGQQAVGGQNYAGFYLAGSPTQNRIRLNGCMSGDFQTVHTQAIGYWWNGNGTGGQTSSAHMTDCSTTGSSTGFNNCGTDVDTLGGTMTTQAGNYTAATNDVVIVYTGTGGHTITLGSPSVNGGNRKYLVRNSGSGAITVASSGTVAVTSLAAGVERIYVSDGGSNWR